MILALTLAEGCSKILYKGQLIKGEGVVENSLGVPLCFFINAMKNQFRPHTPMML